MCVGYHMKHLDSIGKRGSDGYWLRAVEMNSSSPHKCITFTTHLGGSRYYIQATNYSVYKYFNIPPKGDYHQGDNPSREGWALLWNEHDEMWDGTYFDLERV
eukprot:TRINITY_DN6400_c2_g1_i2.p1 TRINITY_DN6400_c2_g1~~TRINITY_DN6400_c2_g1_i2.p1  ORF type:complete len:102 (-),score=8.35 TRINITY_DN6400_c2_g1_i2:238-543(-)